MRHEQLYEHLETLAEGLGISVREENLSSPGNIAASGLCTIKGRRYFIIDRTLPVHEKNKILGECLVGMDLEGVYLLPAVRDFLEKRKKTAEGL